jgi:hypothetical protein
MIGSSPRLSHRLPRVQTRLGRGRQSGGIGGKSNLETTNRFNFGTMLFCFTKVAH